MNDLVTPLYPNRISKELEFKKFFDTPNFKLNFETKDLLKIPNEQAFISISNRPIGFIEEYLIAYILEQRRIDYRFLNNTFLADSSAFYQNRMKDNNLLSLRFAKEESTSYSLFPVGNCSNYEGRENGLTDSKWDKAILKELYQLDLPIIPIYIHLENRNLIKFLNGLDPSSFSKEMLFSLIDKKGLDVKIIIGKAIHKKLYHFSNSNKFSQFLRAKLYGLGSKLKIDLFYDKLKSEELIAPISPELIDRELNAISDTNLISSRGDFNLYLCKAKKIPNTIQEIGRLREESFRNIGEGTNESMDLDIYDLHYLHLFLYDRVNKKIAGAYRIGDGDYIMQTLGKKGFYLHSLFKMKKSFELVLKQSIELGRSFVSLDYQNQRLPLFLLWCGILNYLKNHPKVRYMIGPVSISNSYSHASKGLIVKYIKKYHWDTKLAKEVSPRKAFRADTPRLQTEILVDCTNNKLKLLDQLIEDIDPKHTRIPILLKKYFAQNAKIISFNVDPNFNQALDGFILTRVKELPKENFHLFTDTKNIDYANELS
ncbi:MAG: GNAT family N-acetyltransferase [Chitinophagales bacterium]|nr:GNAT family N-acetyltransferase [Chitinophagales bacterium]